MDDVLAAVDSHVARHVFGAFRMRFESPPVFLISCKILDQVIGPYGLLSTKARILVTNSIAFIKQIDQIVYLRRGIIIEQGTYDQLIGNEEGALYKLM